MTTHKYSAALLSFALVLVGALVAIPRGAFDWQAAIQLAILGVSTGVTLFAPLAPGKWQGAIKTSSAVVLAILSGLTPLILGGVYDHVSIGLIVLAAFQALGSEIGVQARTDPSAVPLPVVSTDVESVPQVQAEVQAAVTADSAVQE